MADLVTLNEALWREIAERDATERALQESEQRYRAIFENAVEGLFQTTPEGRFLSANPAMARLGGYASVEEMLSEVDNLSHQHFVDPETRQEVARTLAGAGALCNFPAQIRRKDGSLGWISTNTRAVLGADGGISFLEGSVVDITDRKRAADQLAEAYNATIEGWSRAMDLPDKEAEGHSKRVTEMTLKLAGRSV